LAIQIEQSAPPTPLGVDAQRARPEARRATHHRQAGESATCAQVENVLAAIPGETADTIVLMAHYDSVPNAPGAGDDGAAVAALLEVTRIVKSGAPYRNTTLLAFTDAEEAGPLGAEAFFAGNPATKRVKAVINLEGSGSSGPVYLLRTLVGADLTAATPNEVYANLGKRHWLHWSPEIGIVLAAIAVAALVAPYSANRPQHLTLLYVHDVSASEAHVIARTTDPRWHRYYVTPVPGARAVALWLPTGCIADSARVAGREVRTGATRAARLIAGSCSMRRRKTASTSNSS
jgi:hypothetical protein